ncbi:hypothetical protein DFJ43DRAFT_872468 [Lentinula guzmanii]|uniref:Uncharacterized protein n=1 Tax=Lentinula guzmanii TaxID=2804957 RepID=A0AA38JU05_9AGAR|nr:hypothetical protein DFJ43DRAFT_872468 [Lentinula guzmanii]
MSNPKPTLMALFTSESLSSLILSLPIIRQQDLASLSIASKAFMLATTPFLYSRVILYSPNAIRKFLFTILHKSATYAAFVHTLYLCSHRGHPRLHHTITREMTMTLSNVLPLLRNLEYIYLSELWGFSAAVFASHEKIMFPLRDCRLNGITFSTQDRIAEFLRFLSTREHLQLLRLGVAAVPDDYYDQQPLPWDETIQEDYLVLSNSLPALVHFDGPVFIATKILKSRAPLEFFRVHTALEYDAGFLREGNVLPVLFSSFIDAKNLCGEITKSTIGKTLKSLVVVGLPGDDELQELQFSKKDPFKEAGNLFGDVIGDLMQILALRCPLLLHVGVLPLSCKDRSEIHAALMEMHSLRSIEFSVTQWIGPGVIGIPSLGLQQTSFPNAGVLKAISIELKMYCPTLRYLVYTLRHPNSQSRTHRVERVVWIYHVRPQDDETPVENETGKNEKNSEGEWVMGDSRSNWDELWTMSD